MAPRRVMLGFVDGPSTPTDPLVFQRGEPLPFEHVLVGEVSISVCSDSVIVGPREHGKGWSACIGPLLASIEARLKTAARRRGAWALQVREQTVFPHYDPSTGTYWLQADVTCDELHRPAA